MAWMLQEIHDDGAAFIPTSYDTKADAANAGELHGAYLNGSESAMRLDVVWMGAGPARREPVWVRRTRGFVTTEEVG